MDYCPPTGFSARNDDLRTKNPLQNSTMVKDNDKYVAAYTVY